VALLEVSAVPSQVEATPEQREHEVAERRDDRHDKEKGDDTIAQQQPEGGLELGVLAPAVLLAARPPLVDAEAALRGGPILVGSLVV
jgi:hypothetical protein